MFYLRNFLQIIFLVFLTQSALAAPDTRLLSTKPKEIYGNTKNIQIRIGNGGAGPTGILRALSEDFLKEGDKKYGIAWYQDISPNTLKQLKQNVIDMALVYEKHDGEKALNEGWATSYTVIFNDHFIIVGPKKNPAKLKNKDLAAEAFTKIAETKSNFLSRDDNSGTNVKERGIWKEANLEPWKEGNIWYLKHPTFPKDALLQADKNSLYTITDWGTWLSNYTSMKNSVIYVRGGESLLNPCFALLGKSPSDEVLEFLTYLKSERAQEIIENFGEEDFGSPLYTKAQQMDF